MSDGRSCSNPACDRRAIPRRWRCARCASYWQRHRADHPGVVLCPKPRLSVACLNPQCDACQEERAALAAAMRCANPVCPAERDRIWGYRRCLACYAWLRDHHTERPIWLTRPAEASRLMPPCEVDGCWRPQRARGLCSAHWQRWRKASERGGVWAVEIGVPCANPACARRAMPKKGGRCAACYLYRWRHGSERPERLTRPWTQRCTARGCDRPVQARGLCGMHYQRRYRRARRAVAS